MKLKIIKLEKRRYPICPECGKHTIVMFSPPKDYLYPKDRKVHPDAYKLLGTQEYVDWDKAHLYCCNGTTNCTFNTKIRDLTTPLKEAK